MNAATGLVLDIGNTSCRIARYANGKITQRRDFSSSNDANGREFFKKIMSHSRSFAPFDDKKNDMVVAIASVASPEPTAFYINLFPPATVRVISGDMPGLPLKFAPGFTQKEKIGADRLANAMGAIALKKHPCVIADFGTALTVDGVNEKGEFIGGMILPGMATLLRAMHQNTARLPELNVPPKPFSKPFGQNTKDAMLAGVEHGYRGLVRETVETLQRALCGKCALLATGGMATRVATASGLEFEINPDLTLLGIAQVLTHIT